MRSVRRLPRPASVIARIWHGRTPADRAEAFVAFLRARALPDYAAADGCVGAYVLHRVDGEIAHVQTLTFWRDRDAVRAFAGGDATRATYYPEADDFLLEKEPHVRLFRVAEGIPLA